jgi:branched-chain amino acid aminotransferase
MILFMNGQFIPEELAVISVADRGFLYGDGLFETIRVAGGQPFRLMEHLDRLQRGADFLKLRVPYNRSELAFAAAELIARNGMIDAILRIHLSRGVGRRGYSPRGAHSPTLVMSVSVLSEEPRPTCWKAIIASFRVAADDPIAQHKTSNKLAPILARMEAEAAGMDEALLLNTRGEITEAASGNLFWVWRETVLTPPLSSSALAGITRSAVLELCHKLGYPTAERPLLPDELKKADGAFLSLSSLGVIELSEVDGANLPSSPITRALRDAYERQLHQPG